MVTFTGTTGNNSLIGTTQDDSFLPLTGQDTVSGGAGRDTLVVDWSSISANGMTGSITSEGGASFGGSLAAPVGSGTSLLFSSIEAANLTLTSGSDTITVNAAPLATAGVTLGLNGGGGFDTLKIDFAAFASTSFAMAANFLITASNGTYAGFEQFDIKLGSGTNSVTLQGGADTIRSNGGIDQIDGGGGRDLWLADFSTWSAAISFGWDGDSNLAAVSNGTSVKGVEGGSVAGGSGDDAFFLAGANPFAVTGGGGRDLLVWDESGRITAPYAAIFNDGGNGTFTGAVRGSAFSGIEQVNAALSDAANLAFVDTAPLAGGATMNLDGGEGDDTLQIDFTSFASTTFAIDASGMAITSHGTYSGFENFVMALGTGANSVNSGAGADTVYSLGGTDRIDGGGGSDFWGGDWSDHGEGIAFTWDGTTGAATLTPVGGATSTISAFEAGYLVGGGGNDSFILSGQLPFDVTGGGGFDTLTRTDDGPAGTTAYHQLLGGGSWFLGWIGNGQFDGIEAIVARLGGRDDSVFVDASPLAGGATLNLDAGLGNDMLLIDFSALGGTSFIVSQGGLVTSNQGSFAGFEAFSIALGGGINLVTTGGGNDTIMASAGGSTTLDAGSGDDEIWGGPGTQSIEGGAGVDRFHIEGEQAGFSVTRDDQGGYIVTDIEPSDGDQGAATLRSVEWIEFADGSVELAPYGISRTFTGTAGADSIVGTAGADAIVGLEGNDNLSGLAGDDTIAPGAGNDTITGGAGFDTLVYDGAPTAVRVNLSVIGRAQTTGGSESDWLVDQFEGLVGSSFNDTLVGNSLANRIEGGGGNDTIDAGTGADTMIGGAGNDRYTVDSAWDVIVENAGEGSDTVVTKVDWTLGNNLENLTMTAGTIPLAATGNSLANIMVGNSGANHLVGLDGNDMLNGGAGADTMDGGLGNDTFTVDNAGDLVVELENQGTDLVNASATFVLPEQVEKLTLTGSAAIAGTGNALANSLTGNVAANTLSGAAGADTISGAGGNDTIIGGAGADVLTGGTGNDSFRFSLIESSAQKDTIKDFAHGVDRLEFAVQAFTGLGSATGPLNPAWFVNGTAAAAADDRVVYDKVSGALYYDPDGIGGAAQVQVAVLSTKPAIDASDIFLV